MDTPISDFVNCGFGWFIVLLALTGYWLTWKRMKEKWLFWIVLAVGWVFFALANTLLIAGVSAGVPYLIAIWLASYILVVASLALLFVTLNRTKMK